MILIDLAAARAARGLPPAPIDRPVCRFIPGMQVRESRCGRIGRVLELHARPGAPVEWAVIALDGTRTWRRLEELSPC